LVVGGGAIGLLAALLLRHLGAKHVTMTELNPLRHHTVQ
jgi:threonine dehydrogenase-like Zn-dependent dehydrogenase